jgi:phytoene dehydrogenase-like protein
MSVEKYDVVIIGAGLGGLTTAGYLAKQGKSVLVLEHHSVPGGYAHEFRRGKYRFEVSLHALDGLSPGSWTYPILHDLEVFEKVPFKRLDPFYTVKFPEHEVTAWADPIRYEAELIRHFPHEADGIRSLVDEMQIMFYELRRFVEDGKLNRLPTLETFATTYPNMLDSMNRSWQSYMEEHIQDPQAQGVVSTLWPYYGLPSSQLSAATFILPWVSYHFFGAYYPEGGSMALSRAIERMIRDYGGTIRYRQTVRHIEMRNGLAAAVETEQGLRVEADVVVSNASAPDTLLNMIGSDYLPEDYANKVKREPPAISNLVVYLGLEHDLWADGWRHHDLFIADTYSTEDAYEKMVAGQFDEAALAITYYNHADPDCAPHGSSVLAIMTLAPWDYANQWGTNGDLTNYSQNPTYLKVKEEAGEMLLENAIKHIPALRKGVKYKEVATPLTNYRYTRNPGGSIYGSEQTIDNMYSTRLNAVTPISNLFLAGAWVMGGGMSPAMLSGRDTAGLVRQYLAGEEVKPLVMPAPPATGAVSDGDGDGDGAPPAEEPVPNITTPATNGKMPRATLTAIGSKRRFDLHALNKPAVLVFNTQETAAVSEEVNHTVDKRYKLVSEVLVLSIVDLHIVPRPFRPIAEAAMVKSYQEVVDRLPEGMSGEEHVMILPDWDGSVTKALGFKRVNRTAAIAVLDSDSGIVGTYQGSDPNTAAMDLLAKVMG